MIDETSPNYRPHRTKSNEIIIHIYEASDGDGYIYDIYPDTNSYDQADTYDGGQCTGSLDDALDMATEQARNLIGD